MKTIEVDGQQITVFAERNDEDGGIITNTLVPVGDGSYYNFRTWEGRGIIGSDETTKEDVVAAEKGAAQDDALAKFNAMTDEEIADRAAKAAQPGISGKLVRE